MRIITAGRTGPNRAVRFGGDPPLVTGGRRAVRALTESVVGATVFAGPERAAGQTCAELGVEFTVLPALRTLNVGDWSGRTPEEIDPQDLRRWFTDPTACPHGGESVATFVGRIHRWRADVPVPPDVCVVAMPVAQALLVEEPAAYFTIDVRPATVYSIP